LGKIDFIIIDGRARKDCLEKAHQILAQNGIVVLHDAQRKYYQGAFCIYKYGILLVDNSGAPGLWIGSKDIDIHRLVSIRKYKKLLIFSRALTKSAKKKLTIFRHNAHLG
jgi:hypothetical protein